MSFRHSRHLKTPAARTIGGQQGALRLLDTQSLAFDQVVQEHGGDLDHGRVGLAIEAGERRLLVLGRVEPVRASA